MHAAPPNPNPDAESVRVNATRCPVCGARNGCAVEAARASGVASAESAPPACWCMEADFSPALLARVPESARGRACICARCARAHPEPV